MAAASTSTTSWIYQGGPSRNEVETEHRYSKTRKGYMPLIRIGGTIPLQSLERAPAPIVCPVCRKPVITILKSERTGQQWFAIAFVTIISAGLFTYIVASEQKSSVHVCPSCESRIAQVTPWFGGSWKVKVLHYDTEDDKSAKILYNTTHMHGSVHNQWNNIGSKTGTQAGGIGTQHQSNNFRGESA